MMYHISGNTHVNCGGALIVTSAYSKPISALFRLFVLTIVDFKLSREQHHTVTVE